MGRLSCFAKGMLKCRRVFLLLPFLHLRCLLIRAVMASPNNMLSVVDLILMAVSGVLMDWNVKETSGGNLANLLLLLILVRKVSLRPTGSVAGLVLMAANSVTVGWTVLSSMLTCFVWLLIHVQAVVPPKVVNNVVALVSLDAVTARLSCFAKEMLKCRRVFLLLPFLHLRCLLICAVMASPNKMLSVVDLILMAVSGVLMDWNVKETSGGNLASRSLLILVREVSLMPTGSVVGLVLMAANSVTVGWTVLSSMLTCFVWLLIHVRAVVPPKVVNNVVALVLQVARNASQDWLVKDLQRCKPANLLIPPKCARN